MLVNDNETFIITGTSRGLGKNLVNYYLNKSKNIIGVSRSSSSIIHKNYTHFTLDVSSENDVKELFRNIRKNFQNINCVINNAAVSYSNNILLTPAKELEHVMKINLIGSFIVIKEAVKLLKKKNHGRIISISSILAKKSLPGTSAYSSSKVALEKLRPPDLDGMDKDVMLTRLRKNWPDWSEDAIMGQFSIFSVNKDNKITKRLSLINHLKILESLWENDSISNLKNIKVPLLLILVKYNTDLTFIKDSNVRIDIERVNGDHDIHAQKPKLVHKIIEKRINGEIFEKK